MQTKARKNPVKFKKKIKLGNVEPDKSLEFEKNKHEIPWQVSITWLTQFLIPAKRAKFVALEDTPPAIRKTVETLLGPDFKPYGIQMQAWNTIYENEQFLLLVSGTGSGKTKAVILPILTKLGEDKQAHCLCIIPHKALSQDLEGRLRKMCAPTDIAIQRYESSVSANAKAKIRDNPGQILITTPDTLMASMVGTKNETWFKYLAESPIIWVDEFHATSGTLGTALIYLIRILYLLNPALRVFLTSATLANEQDIADLLPHSTKVLEGAPVHGTIHFHIGTTQKFEDKLGLLINDVGQFLLFIENKNKIERLFSKYALKYRHVERYHADLPDLDRDLFLSKFIEKDLRGLLCTSAISLGVDIPSVRNIMLYGFPRSFSLLFQETGRGTRKYDSEGNVYLLLDNTKLIDNYYITHTDELAEEILSQKSDPMVIDLLNKKILHGMVLLAIKLGSNTREGLNRIFPEANEANLLEQVLTWLLINGHIMKRGRNNFRYFEEKEPDNQKKNEHYDQMERHRFLFNFITTLRPGFPTYSIKVRDTEKDSEEISHISAENIPYRACIKNYYFINDNCYLIKMIDTHRHEIYVVPSEERYISKNLVATVLSLMAELKFKTFNELKIQLADFHVDVKPTLLRTYELQENHQEVLVTEDSPEIGQKNFNLTFETRGLVLEFTTIQDFSLSRMTLYQLSEIMLQIAKVMINISEGEVLTYQNYEQRSLYFLDKGCPTGVCQQLFENIDLLLEKTYQVLASCTCRDGCRKCAIPVRSNFLRPDFQSHDPYRKGELLNLLRRCLHESRSPE